jgi:hypothetical protein
MFRHDLGSRYAHANNPAHSFRMSIVGADVHGMLMQMLM